MLSNVSPVARPLVEPRTCHQNWIDLARDVEANAPQILRQLDWKVNQFLWRRSPGSFNVLRSLALSSEDVTGRLVVELLEKGRFQRYLQDDYCHCRVDKELSGIEIPNILQRLSIPLDPDGYRIARNVLDMLQGDSRFRYVPELSLFRGRPMRVYGLAEWKNCGKTSSFEEASSLAENVGRRLTNPERRGCKGTAIIISRSELRELLIELFQTVGSPMTVQTTRQLVASKLPPTRTYLYQFRFRDQQDLSRSYNGEWVYVEPPIDRLDIHTPDLQVPLIAKELAQEFFAKFEEEMGSIRRGRHLFWHKNILKPLFAPFSGVKATNQDVARDHGVSDSSISFYQKTALRILSSLGLTEKVFLPFVEEVTAQLNLTDLPGLVFHSSQEGGKRASPPMANARKKAGVTPLFRCECSKYTFVDPPVLSPLSSVGFNLRATLNPPAPSSRPSTQRSKGSSKRHVPSERNTTRLKGNVSRHQSLSQVEQVLALLASKKEEEVVTYNELASLIWPGKAVELGKASTKRIELQVMISRLKKANRFDDAGIELESIQGVGYRIRPSTSGSKR